jgi:hypothetical protein
MGTTVTCASLSLQQSVARIRKITLCAMLPMTTGLITERLETSAYMPT